jgi:hypothetical protein
MRSNRLARVALAFGVVLSAGAIMAGTANAVSATPPHIVAKPNNVMLNTTISLTGTGFPANAKLTIKECSRTSWVVVAQKPCDTNNTITVLTNKTGRFVHAFKVELCPRTSTGTGTGPITRETCYIGNPKPKGVDTITLVGAAKVTVTYP